MHWFNSGFNRFNYRFNYSKNVFAIFSGAVVVGSKGGLMVPGALWAIVASMWDVTVSICAVTASMWAVTSSM